MDTTRRRSGKSLRLGWGSRAGSYGDELSRALRTLAIAALLAACSAQDVSRELGELRDTVATLQRNVESQGEILRAQNKLLQGLLDHQLHLSYVSQPCSSSPF